MCPLRCWLEGRKPARADPPGDQRDPATPSTAPGLAGPPSGHRHPHRARADRAGRRRASPGRLGPARGSPTCGSRCWAAPAGRRRRHWGFAPQSVYKPARRERALATLQQCHLCRNDPKATRFPWRQRGVSWLRDLPESVLWPFKSCRHGDARRHRYPAQTRRRGFSARPRGVGAARPSDIGADPRHVSHHALPQSRARVDLAGDHGGRPRLVPPPLAQPAGHARALRDPPHAPRARAVVPLSATHAPHACLGSPPAHGSGS